MSYGNWDLIVRRASSSSSDYLRIICWQNIVQSVDNMRVSSETILPILPYSSWGQFIYFYFMLACILKIQDLLLITVIQLNRKYKKISNKLSKAIYIY